ncbi:MAG: hypothetical protein KAT11_03520 [Phycisphaerae bacterium]|nr:hypothetical protein [Phycisphaerae bacterium]
MTPGDRTRYNSTDQKPKRFSPILLACLLCFVIQPWPAKAQEQNKPIWLVVTRPIFVKAIQPLAEHRRKDDFETVISTESLAKAIRDLPRVPAFVLLVGDDEPGREKEPWYLPSKRVEKYRWEERQSEYFASDALLGDLDGDLMPDVPVGRIPARTQAELKQIVNKIISFEQTQPTLDDLRLPSWAGAPGFNPVVDSVATGLMTKVLQAQAPRWVTPWLISADPKSPFCGWPPDQSAMFTEQLKRGGLLAVLVGHGDVQYFFSMQFQNWGIGYHVENIDKVLASGTPGPPLVIICCLSGSFAGSEKCLAEALLMAAAGPVAVIGAASESHPLTNYFSGVGLVQSLAADNKRLGNLWLSAQKNAFQARDPVMELLLCNVEGKLEANIDIPRLRQDQVLMYALLGDPATRLHLPGKLHGKIKRQQDGWHWQVHKPEDATKLYVGFRPIGQEVPKLKGELSRDLARENFQRANMTFDFRPLPGPAEGEPWKGTIDKEGSLRLVALGPKKIYVAVLNLKLPAEPPLGQKER